MTPRTERNYMVLLACLTAAFWWSIPENPPLGLPLVLSLGAAIASSSPMVVWAILSEQVRWTGLLLLAVPALAIWYFLDSSNGESSLWLTAVQDVSLAAVLCGLRWWGTRLRRVSSPGDIEPKARRFSLRQLFYGITAAAVALALGRLLIPLLRPDHATIVIVIGVSAALLALLSAYLMLGPASIVLRVAAFAVIGLLVAIVTHQTIEREWTPTMIVVFCLVQAAYVCAAFTPFRWAGYFWGRPPGRAHLIADTGAPVEASVGQLLPNHLD